MDILTLLTSMPKGSAKMAESDPHGLTLTVTSLMVVFGVLLMLFIVYSISGAFFSGRIKKWYNKLFRRRQLPAESSQGADIDAQRQAAIATAIHLYLSETAHDKESYKLTIRQSPQSSPWADKSLTMRRNVR